MTEDRKTKLPGLMLGLWMVTIVVFLIAEIVLPYPIGVAVALGFASVAGCGLLVWAGIF